MPDLPPPPKRKAGWYPDPEGSGRLRFWNKTRWTDGFVDAPGQANARESGGTPEPGPPKKRGQWGGAPWWAWVLVGFVGLVILGAILGGDNSKKKGGTTTEAVHTAPAAAPTTTAAAATTVAPTTPAAPELADEPTGDAEGTGSCPQQTFVGVPIIITMKVTNTGDKTWPVTYLTIDDGADHFVFNSAHMGPLTAEKVDTPAFDTWQLGSDDTGPKPGEQRKITMTLTPKDAGNRDLSYGVWGGPVEGGPIVVPDDLHLVSCSAIPVNP